MNLARVSANGQITVPVEIRRTLGLKSGDKMLFFKKDNGEIVVSNTSNVAINDSKDAVTVNPAIAAMERFSKAMEGEWEKAGIYSEEDLLAWAKEARKEYMEEHRARDSKA